MTGRVAGVLVAVRDQLGQDEANIVGDGARYFVRQGVDESPGFGSGGRPIRNISVDLQNGAPFGS
jgi:hypothetical protein